MEDREQFEVEEVIPVNIIKDSKQMRIAIPAEIVEKFRVNPDRHQFAWIIENSKTTNRTTITGRFVLKHKMENDKQNKPE